MKFSHVITEILIKYIYHFFRGFCYEALPVMMVKRRGSDDNDEAKDK